MYLLLSLREDQLSTVVSLLFSHGHSSLLIGESVEDLCPTCDRSQKNSSRPPSVPASQKNAIESFSSAYSAPAMSSQILPSTSGDSPIATSSHSGFFPSSQFLNPTWFQAAGQSSPRPSTAPSTDPVLEPKEEIDNQTEEIILGDSPINVLDVEEPKDVVLDAVHNDVRDTAGHCVFNAIDAMGLLASTSGHVSLQKPSGNEWEGERKQKRKQPEGEQFQCQLCQKSITRTGQLANVLNHLGRHARLHASKKQYKCPICNFSCSRKYLASAHIRDVHANFADTEPLDLQYELRDEYLALMDVCFPAVALRRKDTHSSSTASCHSSA